MRSFIPLPARTRRSIRLSPLSSAFAALVLALARAHDAGSDVRSFEQDPSGIERYEYVSPRPGSAMVSRWNNVALRPGNVIDLLSRTGLYIVGIKVHRMSEAEATEYYPPLKDV